VGSGNTLALDVGAGHLPADRQRRARLGRRPAAADLLAGQRPDLGHRIEPVETDATRRARVRLPRVLTASDLSS
jgi:hypothetical protein